MRSVLATLAALFIATTSLHAQLSWETKRQVHKASPTETSYKAVFSFKNIGVRPIAVRGVQTSCGCCTTAEFKPRSYAPGESGEIALLFTFGGRIGEQKKSANVLTDDQDSNAALQIEVTIPQLYTMTPGVLYWKKGEALEPKSTTLTINYPQPVKITEATSSDPAVKVKTEALPDGKSFRIVATPDFSQAQNAPLMVKALLTVQTDLPIPGKSNFMVYALVKR